MPLLIHPIYLKTFGLNNVKKQKSKHSNKQKIPQDGCVNTVQNAKLKQVKNIATLILQ